MMTIEGCFEVVSSLAQVYAQKAQEHITLLVAIALPVITHPVALALFAILFVSWSYHCYFIYSLMRSYYPAKKDENQSNEDTSKSKSNPSPNAASKLQPSPTTGTIRKGPIAPLSQFYMPNNPALKVGKAPSVIPLDRLVTDDVFESSLAELEAELKSEQGKNGSLYGDCECLTYKIARESFNFLAGGRASLLQIAHPFVAVGVEQHSNIKQNGVQQRFYRTFHYIFAMTYGDFDKIFAAARSVRRLHNGVKGIFDESVGPFMRGTAYSAHWDDALLWVAATITESSMLMYEMFVEKLSSQQKNDFFLTNRRWLFLFGIPPRIVPETWEEFMEYNRRMWESPTLAVGSAGQMLYKHIFLAPSIIFWPLMKWVESSTKALLPPRVRALYGLHYGWSDAIIFYSSFGMLRLIYGLLPGSMRYIADYLEMERRQGVKRFSLPSKLTALFARVILRLVMPPRSSTHGTGRTPTASSSPSPSRSFANHSESTTADFDEYDSLAELQKSRNISREKWADPNHATSVLSSSRSTPSLWIRIKNLLPWNNVSNK